MKRMCREDSEHLSGRRLLRGAQKERFSWCGGVGRNASAITD